jgi:hypothetical protein
LNKKKRVILAAHLQEQKGRRVEADRDVLGGKYQDAADRNAEGDHSGGKTIGAAELSDGFAGLLRSWSYKRRLVSQTN